MRRAGVTLLALGLMAAPALAQTPQQLKTIEQDLQKSEAERARLATESEKVARDIVSARQQAVTLAKDIQDQEYSLTVLETRLKDLEAAAVEQTAALSRRDAQMRRTLMALERLSLRPADALAMSPLSPDDAVRAAILLRAAVPAISASANSLNTELGALYKLRAEIVDKKEQVAAGAAQLVTKRTKLETTIASKTERQVVVATRGQELTARVGQLSKEAEDLRALFAKLAEEKAKRDAEERKAAEAAKAAAAAQAQKDAEARKQAEAQGRVLLKAPPGATPDAGPPRQFTKAKGTLPSPAVGRITARFGEAPPGAAAGGLMTKGMTVTTRPGATVVSPFDGVVAFAGPFRGYGELLIIEHTEGYHTLLAGLGRIDGTVGQRVLAGEPVGAMNDDKEPALYVELRHDGQPINPVPWLAERRAGEQASR